MIKWPHQSNATDEMLIAWQKTSFIEKMKWLEKMRKIRGKALPKKNKKIK